MERKVLLWAMASSGFVASAADAQHIAFVECPIVRDTSSVPCWLSEYKGELYYLGIQTDVSAEFHPPSLGHKVLVEGEVTDQPRICGGRVVSPVTVSVIPERSENCQTLLMAEDRYALPFEAPRPPGPSLGRLAFTYPPPPPAPKPPFKAKTFVIQYDFDGMVGFSHPRSLTAIMGYANQIGARHVAITGYRAATRLSNGQLLTEQELIGKQRATQISQLLSGAGLTTPEYNVAWKSVAETGDPTRRRVTVTVSP